MVTEFGFKVAEFCFEVVVPREVLELCVVPVEPCCPVVADLCVVWDEEVQVF